MALRCWLVLGVFLLFGCGAASDDLKRRAAFDLGCPHDELELTRIDDRTRGVRGCGRQATCVESCQLPPGSMAGRQCTWILDTAPAATTVASRGSAGASTDGTPPKAKPQVASTEPPDGAAGFTLGMTRDQALAACDRSGHTFESARDINAQCSAPAAGIGFTSQVDLLFCTERLCGIRVYRSLDGAGYPEIVKRISDTLRVLGVRYGEAISDTSQVPERCKDVAKCIADGSLRVQTSWRWALGHELSVKLTQQPLRLVIEYRSPKGMTGEVAL